MGQSRPLFGYFRSFLIPITISKIQIEKSLDGVLGIQTWGCRMVGPDKTTEQWWVLHAKNIPTLCKIPRIVIYNRIVFIRLATDLCLEGSRITAWFGPASTD